MNGKRARAREYKVAFEFNGRQFKSALLDSHYEEKHGENIDDQLIIEILKTQIAGERFNNESSNDEWRYYVFHAVHEAKNYRLIFCDHVEESIFVIINCFREKWWKRKN